jgi:hypothetical protein
MHRQTLRMSVLSGILRIQDYCSTNPHVDPSAAAELLKRGTAVDAGFDYSTAVQAIAVLDLQSSIQTSPVESLQAIIAAIIKRFRPPWTSAIPHGRNQLLRLLSPDEQQCLASARLLDTNPPDSVVEWWDSLAILFRAESAKATDDTGRLGERLSLKFERERLNAAGRNDLVPHWVSIDDNSLGYDIASFEVDATSSPRFIEVKASNASPPQFFVTRNEWHAATRLQTRYLIQVWDLSTLRVAELTREAISDHIPLDQGGGVWQLVRVQLDAGFWDMHSKRALSAES